MAAWNRGDLDAVLEEYAEHVVFRSPRAAIVVPETGGVVRGKAALRSYWEAGLANGPAIRFELDGVFVGVGTVAIAYRNHRGESVVEVMQFNEGLIELATVVHGLER